jgi:hypothetical protein
MSSATDRRSFALKAAVLFALGALGGTILYGWLARDLVRSAYDGASYDWLNRIVARNRAAHPGRELDFYLHRADGLHGLLLFALAVAYLALVAWIYRSRTRAILREFFLEPIGPLNLAFFRIVLFSVLCIALARSHAVEFARLPAEFLVPPAGAKLLVELIPPTPSSAQLAQVLALASSSLALIGLFSRTSAWLTCVFALYALGLPQCYGKVNHYHHVVWFSALLGSSPCGDALSIDAWVRRVRRRRLGLAPAPPAPSVRYSLPLRIVWLAMGVAYFFPGFFKLLWGGFPWALSHNMHWLIYQKWFEIGDWRPALRLDLVPLLPQAGALLSMLIELFFIVLVLHRVTRRFAAVGGLLFHTGILALMNIWFWTMQACYASFLNVEWLVNRLRPTRGSTPGEASARELPRATVLVGSVILLGALLAGFRQIGSGWPFASYPTFAGFPGRTAARLVARAVIEDGGGTESETPVDFSAAWRAFTQVRFAGLLRGVLAEPDAALRSRKLELLWQVLVELDPALERVKRVRFYKETFDVHPDRVGDGPSHRSLVEELRR